MPKKALIVPLIFPVPTAEERQGDRTASVPRPAWRKAGLFRLQFRKFFSQRRSVRRLSHTPQ